MKDRNHSTSTVSNATDVVLGCVEAINKEDFETARSYVSNDMTFDGVLGSRNGAEAYFRDMEKMKLKYHIRKTFENENDVCLLYDLNMQGKTIFVCGWYHVEDGKILSLKVVFDPRPLL